MDTVWLASLIVTVVTAIPVFWQLSRGHPRGLFILFFAEMWERFSYYGMRGLLVFFMTEQFLYKDSAAQTQYGDYASLVYLLPLIGGLLADNYLGTRKAITFGAMLLVLGHMTMGIEGPPAEQTLTYQGKDYSFTFTGRMEERKAHIVVDKKEYEFGAAADGGFEIKGYAGSPELPNILAKGSYTTSEKLPQPIYKDIFYIALALIIMGVGFLKANISTIVGQLYDGQKDPRRDAGFTLYYYGINLGAFWASIVCSYLGITYGWWAGFGAAGFGMLLGLIVFGLGASWLAGKGEPPNPEVLKKPALGPINVEWTIYLLGIAGVGLVWLVVQRHELVGYALGAGAAAILAYLFIFMITQCTFIEAQRIILALILIAASTVFFTLFEQAGSSLNQFAERSTELVIFGVPMSAAQTQSFNAGMILVLAPIFSYLWAVLGRINLDPNPALKFGLALVQVGAGFFVLVFASHFANAGFKVPLIFLFLTYLLHTTGELFLSPVGLSQMTRLSPVAIGSTIMATWFLASAGAQYIGGLIAKLTAAETVAGQVLDPQKALETYVQVFQMIGTWGIGIGAGLIVLSPFLAYLAHPEKADS